MDVTDAIDTTPHVLRPNEAAILAAADAIREALALLAPDCDGLVECKAAVLAMELSGRGIGLPAIAWAIHQMVESGELTAHPLLSLPRPHERGLPHNVRMYSGLDYDESRNMSVPFLAARIRIRRIPADRIPPDYRTRPLTKQEAKRFLGMSLKQLNARIDAGTIKAEKQNRQSYIFDMRDFPTTVKGKLSP